MQAVDTGGPTSRITETSRTTEPPAHRGPGRRVGEPRRRVAFYSHDTQGLGHVRRNIELAAALTAAHPDTDVLLIGSASAAAHFELPPATQLVLLPAVAKDHRGGYGSARLGMQLEEILAMRSGMAAAALRAFAPDVFVVDKHARGLDGELDEALAVLADTRGAGGAPTRMVLGLRDVLDEPGVARSEWAAARTTETVLRHYDEIWVYGDPDVFEVVAEYDLPPQVAELVRYTGYLVDGRGGGRIGLGPTCARAAGARPYVLCLVGGGQDGAELAEAFAAAAAPAGHDAVLVTGPYMDAERRAALAAATRRRPELSVHAFLDDPAPLIRDAGAIVSMGGYNTVCEVLASGRPGLVVPRVRPRLEQALRIDRLSPLTGLDRLRPDRATPERLAAWLREAVRRPDHPDRANRADHLRPVRLDGLATVPGLVDDLLSRSAPQLEVCRAEA